MQSTVDRKLQLEGEIAGLQWLEEKLPDMEIAFTQRQGIIPADSFIEGLSEAIKEFGRKYIMNDIELYEGELRKIEQAEKRRNAKVKYEGDGYHTCRVCGKPLCFEAYDREDYVFKQSIRIRGKIKTVYYCGYNCRRKDEK